MGWEKPPSGKGATAQEAATRHVGQRPTSVANGMASMPSPTPFEAVPIPTPVANIAAEMCPTRRGRRQAANTARPEGLNRGGEHKEPIVRWQREVLYSSRGAERESVPMSSWSRHSVALNLMCRSMVNLPYQRSSLPIPIMATADNRAPSDSPASAGTYRPKVGLPLWLPGPPVCSVLVLRRRTAAMPRPGGQVLRAC